MKKLKIDVRLPLTIIIVFASFFVIGFGCTSQNNEDFSFAFMTDIHVMPELDADKGFAMAIDKVNQMNPDFVITGGDLIRDALEENEERATELYDLYENISQNLNMPVYNTMGNHEVFGLWKTSGISPDHKLYGRKMYLERMGYDKTYYSWDYKGWHFIVLDGIGFTEDRYYYGNIDSTQLAWLDEDLNKVDKQTPIVISTHIPLVSIWAQVAEGGGASWEPGSAIGNSNKVIEKFADYNLKLVLQGHLHIVEDLMFKDVHYITGGAVCAAWWKGPREGFPEGFVNVKVKGDEFSWSYETFGWQAEPESLN